MSTSLLKHFTWRKFAVIAVFAFLATLAIDCVWNLADKDPVSVLFTTSALLHRVFEAIFVGVVVSAIYR
jgi:hypothetical protein